MYKEKDFEYDIYSNDGKWFVKIKATGKVAEVNNETLKYLRTVEKQITRDKSVKGELNSDNPHLQMKASVKCPVSYENLIDNDGDIINSVWLKSFECTEDEIDYADLEERFIHILSDYQKEIYFCVMKYGESQTEFAERHGLQKSSVGKVIKTIQKKFEKFYSETLLL